MKRLIWLISIFTAACSLYTGAQLSAAPDVVRGKFVYTIPADFDPPLIGRSGIAEIQNAAKGLRFPYYVVLVESINGETDEDAANYIDSLAEQWQKDPDFNSARSSIFLLSYNPRKYRFLAGSKWEAELGFTAPAHAPFNAIFEDYIQRSRKDPKTGIIRMMQAVDRHLVVESDPKTIAARKEAARKAEIARREAEERAQKEAVLKMAREQLSTEITALNRLLANDQKFLPVKTDKYWSAREHANQAIQGEDRDKILGEAASLRVMNSELGSYVGKKKREARDRVMRLAGQTGAAAIVLLFAIVFFLTRARRYGRLKREFEEKSRQWDERILNAQPKYLNFEKERQMIAGLRDLGGRTGEVYENTTHEVDDIFITIGAMRSRVEGCRSTAKRASFINPNPLQKAITDLENEFTFDSGQLSQVRLFDPETRQVSIKPSEIANQLEERFQRTIEQWEHLKKAAEIRFRLAEEIFSQRTLDEVLKTADEHGIPHRWLADHPLFGDDQSDKALYTRTNEGRMNDPAAYLERLESLQNKETEVIERLDRLVKAIKLAKAARIDSIPDPGVTVLQPQDDPRVTLDAARREEARFAGLLASRDDVREVEEQAEKVQELYRNCVEQAVMVQAAVSEAEGEINQARTLIDNVSALAQDTEKQVGQRMRIHSNMTDVVNSLNNGRRFLEAGRTALQSASALLSERRHVEAQSTARYARTQIESARQEFTNSLDRCQSLDEAKRLYEKELAEMENRLDRAERRMRSYGGSSRMLQRYEYPDTNSAVNYYLLLSQLQALESAWDTEVRNAMFRYEEAERRRREEEEEERRRSSSDSFFSSSSGSSWGGDSSSSSSGGSWGGSDSSSSSSGGSW